jgi:hypothetical protein
MYLARRRPEEREREVIGVVRDIPTRLDRVESEPVLYASLKSV